MEIIRDNMNILVITCGILAVAEIALRMGLPGKIISTLDPGHTFLAPTKMGPCRTSG